MGRGYTSTEKVTKFIAVSCDGSTKEYKRYSSACGWLDTVNPDKAIAGFTITYSTDGKTAWVRHA